MHPLFPTGGIIGKFQSSSWFVMFQFGFRVLDNYYKLQNDRLTITVNVMIKSMDIDANISFPFMKL